ncbi:uncharacterized protein LOC128883337 isoform X2 [Hylaeus volcanicus]|uniref:uncharacterized protein LOC128883337 isoform X2 n=1 Tax=Hylaeus volcanicus TaxID=313075 RepID=UPI0023B781FC|nr:uncharacterized protein LOC128883337 isoform X2 [Hylaeus volcanicus]
MVFRENVSKLKIKKQKYITHLETVLRYQQSLLQENNIIRAGAVQGYRSKTFSSNIQPHNTNPRKYPTHHGQSLLTDFRISHSLEFGDNSILYDILQRLAMLFIFFEKTFQFQKKQCRSVINKTVFKKRGVTETTNPVKDRSHSSWVLNKQLVEKKFFFIDSQSVNEKSWILYDHIFKCKKFQHHLMYWPKATLAKQKQLDSKNQEYKKKIETYENSAHYLQTQLDKQERKLQDLQHLLRQERREKIKLEQDCQRLLSKILELKWIKVPPLLVDDALLEKTIDQCDVSQPSSHSFFY